MMKIQKVIFILMLSTLTTVAHAEAPCPSTEILTSELLEFETSGFVTPNPKPNCVDPKKYSHVKPEVPPIDAGAKIKPLVVDETKPFTIGRVKSEGRTNYKVEFVWNTVDAKGAKKSVSDYAIIARYDGVNRKTMGCAVFLQRPANPVTRASCALK